MEGENSRKMPAGMIIICVLLGLGALRTLAALRLPAAQLGPLMLSGARAALVLSPFVIIPITLLYGIIRRLRWAKNFMVGWQIFSMAFGLLNTVSFFTNEALYKNYIQKNLPPNIAASHALELFKGMFLAICIFSWIIASTIIVYVLRRKDYFVN